MRRFLVPVLFGLLGSATGLLADPITVGIVPIGVLANVGDTPTVDVVVSNLGQNMAPSLGAYDLTVMFNASVLQFVGLTYGGSVANQTYQDELAIMTPSTTQTTPNASDVEFLEVSNDTPQTLDTLQDASFTVAQIQFMAIAPGVSPLTITINTLGDSIGNNLPGPYVTQNGTVTVGDGTTVPEPNAFLLLYGGLGLLVAAKRKLAF